MSVERKTVVLSGDLMHAVATLAAKDNRSFTNMVEVLLLGGLYRAKTRKRKERGVGSGQQSKP